MSSVVLDAEMPVGAPQMAHTAPLLSGSALGSDTTTSA